MRSLLAHAGLSGRSVLEIGCGTGRYTAELAPHAERYVAVERSPQMLELARTRCARLGPGLELLCADARSIPLPDGSFDQVIAAWVIVNLKHADRAAALREIARVSRESSDCGTWLIENHWSGQFQDLRGKRSDVEETRIRDLMATAGFELKEVVRTELRFPSAAEAERVLGYLCGDAVRERLRRKPTSTLSHDVIILHRPSTRPAGR